MFKVTIKQYVKPLCALILIAAVLNSGCLNEITDDMPTQLKTNEKSTEYSTTDLDTDEKITDYMTISTKKNDDYRTITYKTTNIIETDLDGDGTADFKDFIVNKEDGDIKKSLELAFGIKTTSGLHNDIPNIDEFVIRQYDLDNDGRPIDKVELYINGEFIYETTIDVNQDQKVDIKDIMILLRWNI